MAKSIDSRVRVRYAETDQMGIAHHANYLVWFEIGRTDFCRAAGTSYREIEEFADQPWTSDQVAGHVLDLVETLG